MYYRYSYTNLRVTSLGSDISVRIDTTDLIESLHSVAVNSLNFTPQTFIFYFFPRHLIHFQFKSLYRI